MMRFLSLFLFICSLSLNAEQIKAKVSASSALLMNAKNGAILHGKEMHKRCYPASITKIATALYALEKKQHALDELVCVSPDAIAIVSAELKRAGKHPSYRLEPDGSSVGLEVGERISLRSLFYGLLMASGNDAANVIAEHVSGSPDQFVDEMNDFVAKIGATNTHFTNPHGLHDEQHVSTAHDIALITRSALKNPFFREVVGTVSYEMSKADGQMPLVLKQTNKLLRPGPYYYPKAFGIKTGYHSQARHALVAGASDRGRELIAVLLSCPEMADKFRDATTLFESAFAEKPLMRTLFSCKSDTYQLPLKEAVSSLIAELPRDVTLSYFPSEEAEYSARIKWKELQLPIKRGDCVGCIEVLSSDGEVLTSEALIASHDVERKILYKVFHFVSSAAKTLMHQIWIPALFALLNGVVLYLLYRAKKTAKDAPAR